MSDHTVLWIAFVLFSALFVAMQFAFRSKPAISVFADEDIRAALARAAQIRVRP